MTRGIYLAAMLAAATTKNHQGLKRPATEADLLRAYAFSQCVASASDKTAVAEDALRSADLYFQGGKVAGEAFQEVRKAIPTDLMKPTPYDGKSIAVFKCIEFYESPNLKALVRKLANRPAK